MRVLDDCRVDDSWLGNSRYHTVGFVGYITLVAQEVDFF